MERSTIVAQYYQIKKKLGEGSFGEIWSAVHQKTGQKVAIKFEDSTSKQQQLYAECKIYLWLHESALALAQALPKVYYYGIENEKNILVMDLLGRSLESLFSLCGRKFSLKTVAMLGIQMIKRVEYVHKRRILHRDIKPDNFAIGIKKNRHRVYILDFGLAKKFMNSSGKHIKYKDGKSLTGTARYASVNTHIGIEQSRRDDLEAVAYLFVYFLKGKLPWQGLRIDDTKVKYKKIRNLKNSYADGDLCEGLPKVFYKYLKCCRDLKFEEEPEYKKYRTMLKDLIEELGYEDDYQYDWVVRNLDFEG